MEFNIFHNAVPYNLIEVGASPIYGGLEVYNVM